MKLFLTFILIGFIQSLAFGIEAPKLIGDYNVAYQFEINNYEVDDLVNKKSLRPISYGILYPTTKKSGVRLKLSDINPTVNKFDPVEFKYRSILQEFSNYYSDFDSKNALSQMKEFYEKAELNAYKDGEIVKDKLFPVLIFSPGAGSQRESYLEFLEQIASLGVIVVALDVHQWEAGEQVVFDESNKKYLMYLNEPDFNQIPRHSHHHMRAMDIKEAIRQIRKKHNKVFEQVDLGRIFVSGHSYGGHTAFYSIRLNLNVKGFINFDGAFSPYSKFDHYDTKNIKENVHLLCVGDLSPHSEVKLCENIFGEFKDQNIEHELQSFYFSTLTGWNDVSHQDFGYITYALELFPKLVPKNDRHLRESTDHIWHRISKWTIEILNED